MRAVVGIQAQDTGAASLGIRARLAGSTASSVERARSIDRTIVRVWCMRGTLHYVAAEDARWLVALLGPVGLGRNRRRIAALGVDNPDALDAVRSALADGPLTRHELAAEARRRGVRLAEDPQAPVHMVARAAMHGYVCEAAPRDGKPTYALVDDWLGPADGREPGREAALAELGRRYAAAHAPAGPEDLAAWSGLAVRDAREAFAAGVGELPDPAPRATPFVRLLPAFDGVLLAHRDRNLTVRPEHARAVLPGGGVLRPTLLVDGRVEGTWRIERGKPVVTPFGSVAPAVEDAVTAEAADVVRHRSS